MIALYIIAALILLIVFFLLLPIRVIAEYGRNGASAIVRAGPVCIRLYPKEKKPKEKTKQEKEGKQGGTVEAFRDLLEHIGKAAARIRKKLVIDDLQIDYLAAAGNPVWAAMGFGLASASIGVLIPILEQQFTIRNRNFRTGVSYTLKKSEIYGKAVASLRVDQILFIGLEFLKDYVKKHGTDGKAKDAKPKTSRTVLALHPEDGKNLSSRRTSEMRGGRDADQNF